MGSDRQLRDQSTILECKSGARVRSAECKLGALEMKRLVRVVVRRSSVVDRGVKRDFAS